MSKYPDMEARYSAAIDEIYALRAILASDARIVEAHLELKSFPKSRRAVAEAQVDRMRRAARGERLSAYMEIAIHAKDELKASGADVCLTNWQWERQQGWEAQ